MALAITTLALAVTAPAWAQVQIESTRTVKPEQGPELGIVPPPFQREERPHDADTYPGASPRVEHDPAFIEPLTAEYQTPTGSGRYGLAGWVSPNTPVGSQIGNYHEVTGYFGLGFSIRRADGLAGLETQVTTDQKPADTGTFEIPQDGDWIVTIRNTNLLDVYDVEYAFRLEVK